MGLREMLTVELARCRRLRQFVNLGFPELLLPAQAEMQVAELLILLLNMVEFSGVMLVTRAELLVEVYKLRSRLDARFEALPVVKRDRR